MNKEFTLIYEALKSNPFTKESINLYQELTGNDSNDRDELRLLIGKKLFHLAETYILKPQKNLHSFPEKEQESIKYFYLFAIYLKYTEELNQLIIEQLILDEPIQVSFYKKVHTDLKLFGFEEHSIAHYFSMFYQLRRAYYFIDHFLKGSSELMAQVRIDIWNCIFTSDLKMYDTVLWNRMDDFSILLTAPTGTGKSMVAKAIAYSSYIHFNENENKFTHSFKDLFKSINLTEYAETLIESELFGYEKGAFTDAQETRTGVLSKTTPSHTIFLDEIGETPTHIQIKLLRVLQDRTFYPLGSQKADTFYGRIIGATNKTLQDLRDPKQFRSDFFYRLSANIIQMPTLASQLSQTPNDIDIFIDHISQKILNNHYKEYKTFIKKYILDHLSNYQWPGNVRELEQCIRRLIISRKYNPPAIKSESMSNKEITAHQLIQDYTRTLFEKHKSYAKVSQILQLDRRTVKKYITETKNDD